MLRLKHWQVFLILLAATFINNFELGDNQTVTTILSLTGMIIYFSWMFFVGHGLYQILPNKIELNYNLFIINSFVWLAANVALRIVSDEDGMAFTGLAALPGFYVFYALLHFIMFPVRTLRSIEKGKKAEIGECIGDFFLVLFLPIGIWFLQPRINKVAADLGDEMTINSTLDEPLRKV